MARRAALRAVEAAPAVEPELPDAPADLSDDAAAWWREVVGAWSLAPDELALLGQACQALDRVLEARAMIDADGMIVDSLHGDGSRLHPAYVVERDGRLAFGRLVKQLDLPRPRGARNPLALPPRRGRRGA